MIKNTIIIDDSKYKTEYIAMYIQKIFPDCNIITFESMNPALYYISKNKDNILNNQKEWLIISDMMMPLYDGGTIERYGAKHILRELARLKLECPVIVQSSEAIEETVVVQLRRYYNKLVGTVKESSTIDNTSVYRELLKDYI